MSAMQIKRGTTSAWARGPELVDFENLSIRDKDSVIDCYKNTITMTLGAPSMNAPYKGADKTNGIAIISASEYNNIFVTTSGAVRIAAKIEPVNTEDQTRLATTEWGLVCYHNTTGEARPLLNKNLFQAHTSTTDPATGVNLNFFVDWSSDLCSNPIDVKITISIRDVYNATEELLPGQLGAEYFAEGGYGIKVGTEAVSNWSELPYLGQVLPSAMYGDSKPEDGTGVPGQIFFVRASAT